MVSPTSPFVAQTWAPLVTDGLPRRFTRAGIYRAYVPEVLTGRAISLQPQTLALVDEAHALALTAVEQVRHGGLGQIGDLLVRSEASASSLIEGYEPTAKAVALADFVERGRSPAVTVARNLRAVRKSLTRSTDPSLALVAEVCELHTLITPGSAGLRQQPVWIGGATPLDAHYNAPPHEQVRPLLDDLETYLAARTHHAVIAGALAHAQFETIHPFTDGNGRAGRVLLGIVLSQYGLTPDVALPISSELFRDRQRYYTALDAYRHGDDDTIVAVIADAVCVAAQESVRLTRDVAGWQRQHLESLTAHLAARSATGRVRRGAAHQILEALPGTPVLDVSHVAATLGLSDNAARNALEVLADVGVLHRDRKTDRTKTVYVASELLALVGTPVPARRTPSDGDVDDTVTGLDEPLPELGLCGAWLPRAGAACALPAGHRGQHRPAAGINRSR